jgi:hypothetical protein
MQFASLFAVRAQRMSPGPPVRRAAGPRLGLPWWFWLGYADVKYWFVTLPAAVALVLIGWYGADWLHGLRPIAFAAAILLALPFPLAAALIVFQHIRIAERKRALQRLLEHAETVAGLALPAGTRIHFSDEDHTNLVAIDLPHATGIRGALLAGRLEWGHVQKIWSGTLAADQDLGGLPCRGPDAVEFDHHSIELDDQGIVQRCQLARDHELLGLTLPRGTTVYRGGEGKPWRFRLPPHVGVAIPALLTRAPPGVTMSVANDGRLVDIGSGHGQTIVVRGVPLSTMFYIRSGITSSVRASMSAATTSLLP